jgi:UDPglucose 6-dehydrogenase
MKIGIAGYGFVGKAHEKIFKEAHEIIISDPAQGEYGNLAHADCVIVCVSTPQKDVSGHCDVTNVCDVIDEAPDVPILIKSTISPEGWRLITDTCKNKNITFSPEFLRAAHWEEDATAKKDFYFGGASVGFWSELFLTALGRINITPAEPEELILMKQLRNSYLATKVTFFNQVYDYCVGEGVDFEKVRKFITADDRIGESHSHVTKERGFGGHCLPKDTLATVRSANVSANTRMTLLEEALDYNNSIRKDRT